MFSVNIITIIFALAVINLSSMVFFMLYIWLTGEAKQLGLFVASKAIQGLSWFLRIFAYMDTGTWIAVVADLLLGFGFALESMLFVRFKGGLTKGVMRFYQISLGLIVLAVFSFGFSIPTVKDLTLLLTYLIYMSMASWYLLSEAGRTRFQVLLGILYGIVPLLSTVMFVTNLKQVTIVGEMTTPSGIIYYILILLMQVVGSVGYLLMFKEKDESSLKELASQDALTGILNRKVFFQMTEVLFHRAIRNKQTVSFLMIDIDLFKRVNDTYGHQVGDRVIKHLCRRITGVMRKSDIFARYGGEEFVVFLPETEAAGAKIIAQRIENSIQEELVDESGSIPKYTLSIGISSGIPEDLMDLDRLLNESDQALYYCKQNGRNRSAVYEKKEQAAENTKKAVSLEEI